MTADKPILSHPIDVAAIPAAGTTIRLVASEAERKAVAAAWRLLDVGALEGDLTVTRKGGIVTVEGRVVAKIVQACVVSLEPVPQEIDEVFLGRYAAEGSAALAAVTSHEADIDEDAAPPEPFAGPALDLGAVLLEHFSLAIDPYPRAPGAVLTDAPTDPAALRESPFAALSGLAGKRR